MKSRNGGGIQVGVEQPLGVLDDGTEMFIVLDEIDYGNPLTRAATSTSGTFTVKYKTILGTTATAFQVKLTCSWNKNGSSSKISNLSGTYSNVASGFSCSWDTGSKWVSDTYHALYLDVYGQGGYGYYACDAMINTLSSNPYCDLAVTQI